MMPPRFPILLLCVGLLLVGCSAKSKKNATNAIKISPLRVEARFETMPAGQATVVHLRSGKKRPPGRGPDDGHAYVHRGVAYVPSGEYRQRGLASWYGGKFHGRRTACGERFDMHGDTAAHRTLPMHTRVLVRNLDNGRSTVARINDRGPYVRGRIIDLSYAKARELGFVRKGTARVELVALRPAPSVQAGDIRPSAALPNLKPARSKRRPR